MCSFPKNQKTFARVTGYVEQEDMHLPQVGRRIRMVTTPACPHGPRHRRRGRQACSPSGPLAMPT